MAEQHPTQHLTIDGRCLCGKTHYHAEGESFGILYCHCQRCRKHNGAALVGFLSFRSGRITWDSGKDELGGFATEATVRNFCRDCGSSMPYPREGDARPGNMYAGNVLSMDAPIAVGHVYTASGCPWYQVPEDEPHWDTVLPELDDQDPKLDDLARHTEPGRITGSCLCGAVAFAAGSPLFMMNCHCTRCRLSRSAPHATNLFVSPDDFEWQSGENRIDRYKVPDAERFTAAWCRDCGSLVPHVGSSRVNVPAGCLDSDPGIGPRGHIYTASKANWFEIKGTLPQWRERA